ncbi:hypothetical protein CVT25_007939 [Psilocybe cyanescens]|uniref:Glutaredoxin domain-containing protein n=1 Tax=Psilocybe cyanescens TaxID=93625 RepID=A0A409XQU6_PSICY|nr:hypothetical protein CVT25_007939 [Psilocybe cyanescens]
MSSQYASKHGKGMSPIRRRRFTLGAILLVGVLLFFFVPWEIPLSFGSTLSRASVARLAKSKKGKVGEIYGLLHLVTGDHEQEHVLSNAVHLDPTLPIELSFYGGDVALDWNAERDYIDTNYPVIVFSKICRFSQRAKDLIATYNLQPPPHIVEVDLRDDGNVIKTLLTRLTGQSTFPNILLQGTSIGGSDRLQELHDQKVLKKIFQEAGATPHSS